MQIARPRLRNIAYYIPTRYPLVRLHRRAYRHHCAADIGGYTPVAPLCYPGHHCVHASCALRYVLARNQIWLWDPGLKLGRPGDYRRRFHQ